MGKLAVEKHSIVHYFKKGYGSLFSSFAKVQPQMPKDQIALYLKQAVKKKHLIIIQVNPTSYTDSINEYIGTAHFSPRSAQIILSTESKQTTFLINARDIRHVRLI